MGREHYEPYIKAGYPWKINRVFPFKYLSDEFAPLMKLIIRYFSCEGRFLRLYAYHVRLLMHFTRVRMMNIPFFMCRNIERMVPLVQRKSLAHQHKSIYHYAFIKIIVMHQLAQQGITWEDFISCDYFEALQPPPKIVHDEGGPSHQPDIPETEHISAPPYVTYQRGHRALFASTRRVLSPPGVEGVSLTSSAQRVLSPPCVEGASLSTSAPQVQDKGKKPKYEQRPSGEPSGFVTSHD